MAEPKTRPTDASVDEFIESVDSPIRREDAKVVDAILQEITGEKPVMWGTAIIGYGSQPLKYESGRELDWPTMAFSPRKAQTTIYLMEGFDGYDKQLAALGKHKTSKGCLYITNLKNVDLDVLRQMLESSHKYWIKQKP